MKTVKFKAKIAQVPNKDGKGVKEEKQAYMSPEGKAYLPGTEATVTDKQAIWLEANGFAEVVEQKESKQAKNRETK